MHSVILYYGVISICAVPKDEDGLTCIACCTFGLFIIDTSADGSTCPFWSCITFATSPSPVLRATPFDRLFR